MPLPNLDVLSYKLELDVPDVNAATLQGKLRVKFKLAQTTDRFRFHTDARRIQVRHARLNDRHAKFAVIPGTPGGTNLTGETLEFRSLRRLRAGATHTLVLNYEVKVNTPGADGRVRPEGFFSLPAWNGTPVLSTRSWPYYTRAWMPVHDHPSDVATFSSTIRVPLGMVALTNGEPRGMGLVRGPRGQRMLEYNAALTVPTPTYNFSIVVGRFKMSVEEVCFNKTGPLSDELVPCTADTHRVTALFHLPPNHPREAEFLQNFSKANRSLSWFARLLGKYEFPKSGIVVAPHPFSMEHTGLITLINPRSAVHEIAHHWWGNAVQIASWGDFWISEGFTTYMDGLYHEWTAGTDTSCRQTTGTLAMPADTDPMTIFDNTAYCKGAATLNGLRETIATLTGLAAASAPVRDTLYAVLRAVYQEYRFKGLSTDLLVEFLRATLPAMLSERHGVPEADTRAALEAWRTTWLAPAR